MNATRTLLPEKLCIGLELGSTRIKAVLIGPGGEALASGSHTWENKLVDGTVNQAIARVKREACVKNAIRLGLNTPCAKTGACHAAECTNPMCRAVVVLEGAPGGKETHVILIDEVLGF